MPEPIRILHVLGTTNLGGAESRIMDLYRHIDRERIQFDFLVHTKETGYFDEEIQRLGGRIYRVPRFQLYNYLGYRNACRDFFAAHHEYRAVQGHMTSTAGIYLPIAGMFGIPIKIAHARSAGVDKGLKGRLVILMRRNLVQRADFLFTCSRIAGVSVFGARAVSQGRTIYVANAIDTEKFAYQEETREKLRQEMNLSGAYVIGHVGRFHYAKNHEYLLRIFAKLCEKEEECGDSFVLLLLGEGAGMGDIKALARQLGIQEKVLFLGNRGNVADYYQVMDYFVYPSRFEGLPGTVVEAQCAGLRCLISDTICEEVAVTELVNTGNILEEPEVWAEKIRQTSRYVRRSYTKEMSDAGFDVKIQAEKMMNFYETGNIAVLSSDDREGEA